MSEWQLIETAPECNPLHGKPMMRVLVYSAQLGVLSGEIGRFMDHVHANVVNLHGNAVEHWGVTHWMPLPEPPVTL